MLKGSVAVRRSSSPMKTPAIKSFPPIAVDSLHHHPINNHNSHQHMSRVKASSRSVSSSDSSCSSAGSSHVCSTSADSQAKNDKEGEDECLAPRRFVERYSLPRVVRVVSSNGQRQKPMTSPLAQPLLLYRQYSTRKVAAKSLQRNGKNVGSEIGPPMVIPDSYQGWFSLVRERSLQTRAKIYSTIQQLVQARVAAFLTKNLISGLRLPDADATTGSSTMPVAAVNPNVMDCGISLGFHGGRRLQYVRTTVRGGHVLRLLAVFEDSHHAGRLSTRERGLAFLGGRGNSTNGDVHGPQYAQCLTHRNEEIFVPVSTSGQFFVVNSVDPETSPISITDPDLSRVYQLPQLLRLTSEPLPVKVQLVCGPVQAPLPPGFTGLLLLESVQRNDVILACTLPRSWALPSSKPLGSAPSTLSAGSDGQSETSPADHDASGPQSATASTEKPIFLEMDADSRFLLMRPLSNQEAEIRFFKTPLVQRVLCYCRDRAELWCSQIKVIHHIFPTPNTPPLKPLISQEKEKPIRQVCKTKRVLSPNPPSSADVSPSSSSGSRCGIASGASWGGSKKSASFRYASSAQVSSPSSSSTGSSSGPSLLQQIRSRLLHRTCSAPNQNEEDAVHISDIFPELRGERPTQIVSSSRQSLRFYADELPYANVADAITSDVKAPRSKKNCNHQLFHHHHFEDEVDDDEDENIYAEICECPRNSVISGAKVILRTTCSTERSGYFTFQSANSVSSCYLHLGGSDGTLSGTMSSSNPSNPEEESVYDTVC